jgi:signal transduction histidine kinase
MHVELPRNPDTEKPAPAWVDLGKASQTIELIEHIARSALECAGATGAFLTLSGPDSASDSSVHNQMLKSLIRDHPTALTALMKGECVRLAGLAVEILSFQSLKTGSVVLVPVNAGAKLHGVLCFIVPDPEPALDQSWLDPWRRLCRYLAALIADTCKRENATNHELKRKLVDTNRSLAETKRKIRELQWLSQMRAHFYAHTLHDLRTPLSAIRGYVKLTLREYTGQIDAATIKFLTSAMEHANRMTRLVSTLERLGNSPQQNFDTFDICELWKESLQLLRPLLEKKMIRVVEQMLPGPIIMIGDRQKLWLVLHRLLSDTIRYSNVGGELVGEFRNEQEQIKVRISASGDVIPGETAETRPDADDPGVLTRGNEKDDFSAVHDVIRLHGGSMSVTSATPGRRTFALAFPLPQVSAFERSEVCEQIHDFGCGR